MLTYKALNKMTPEYDGPVPRLWIRSAEERGERHYENGNTTTTPEYITQLSTPMSETHTLNLRSVKNGTLLVPLSRTKLFHDSFSCSAPRMWNSLPVEIRNSKSLNIFKKNIKPLC